MCLGRKRVCSGRRSDTSCLVTRGLLILVTGGGMALDFFQMPGMASQKTYWERSLHQVSNREEGTP